MVPEGLLMTCAEGEGACRLADAALAEGAARRDLRACEDRSLQSMS